MSHFSNDVFLSHRSKDKEIVRPLAEQLWAEGQRAQDARIMAVQYELGELIVLFHSEVTTRLGC